MIEYGKAFAELTTRELRDLLGLVQPLEGETDPIDELSDDERKAFVSRVAIAYPDLERVITTVLREQIVAIARHAENEAQMFGARGGINAADILLARFRGY